MKLSLIVTGDGSVTFRDDVLNEQFHSVKGAISESEHVYIQKGLKEHSASNLSIFEVGFGTGLNAYLSLIYSGSLKINIHYTAIELFPLEKNYYKILNYPKFFPPAFKKYLGLMHQAPWGKETEISEGFTLLKIHEDFTSYCFTDEHDLVYFDAFGPAVQPEIWSREIFRKIYTAMKYKGILVTYSASGNIRIKM